MKNLICVFAIFLGLSSCNSDDSAAAEETGLIGKWVLNEAFISAGGEQFWVDVENGEQFVFCADRTFTSSRYPECSTGVYVMNTDELRLNYGCEGFVPSSQNQDGWITFALDITSDYFILRPTSGPICVEGCSYKYQKR